MFVDFKIVYIVQEHISTRALSCIYLGDITTEDEPDDDEVMQAVTRYRRQEILEEVPLYFSDGATQADIEATMRERLKTARADTLPIEEQRDA